MATLLATPLLPTSCRFVANTRLATALLRAMPVSSQPLAAMLLLTVAQPRDLGAEACLRQQPCASYSISSLSSCFPQPEKSSTSLLRCS